MHLNWEVQIILVSHRTIAEAHLATQLNGHVAVLN